MKTAIQVTALVLSILCATACGGASNPAASPSGGDGAIVSASAPFGEQAAAGQKLYAANCAACHGATGAGKDAPRLVGMTEGALPLNPPPAAKLRKQPFRSAADVAAFVVKSMPPGATGKLREAEYWEILAFDLKANGVDLGTTHLDASSAPSVVIHP